MQCNALKYKPHELIRIIRVCNSSKVVVRRQVHNFSGSNRYVGRIFALAYLLYGIRY